MPARHALVIAVDGLRASALGAYGNTWHDTPALDALASRSLVHDWMMIRTPELADFYLDVWEENSALLRRLAEAGVVASLTTDDAALGDAQAANFAEICRLDSDASGLAPTAADTGLARLFALAVQQLLAAGEAAFRTDADQGCRLWWLHARGLHGPWDAPLDLRQSLLEEDDPPAPTFTTPPSLAADAQDDELLLCRVAYAAQVMVLDECVGALMSALAESGLDEHTLVILTGCRGFSLGEHGAVGGNHLYSELLHVPCMLRLPDATTPRRCAALAQPTDSGHALLRWFGIVDSAATASREFAIASGADGECAIRTPAWMLRQPPPDQAGDHPPAAELYAKPDDRWEANEIASRCPEVVARLSAALDHWRESGGDASRLPALDHDLVAPDL